MTLLTYQICPRRAQKDIECYKVFIHCDTQENPRRRIFKHLYEDTCFPYSENLEICAEGNVDVQKDLVKGRFRINGGMLHAFSTEKQAKYFAFMKNAGCTKSEQKYIATKCIIPKGTLYYKGVWDDICAKKMILKHEIR